jgi:opacity protein-like surface antigen
MTKISTLILAMLVSITAAHAGKNTEPADSPVIPVTTVPFYIGIGGVMGVVSAKCPCGERLYDRSNFGGIVRVGYDFSPFFGVEARILRSQLSKNFATTTHYGLYAKPQIHINDAINIYALIGYGHTKINCDYQSKPLYEGNGWSLGAGMEYDFASADGQGDAEEGWGMFVDYQNILRDAGKNAVRSNVVSAGITYDF